MLRLIEVVLGTVVLPGVLPGDCLTLLRDLCATLSPHRESSRFVVTTGLLAAETIELRSVGVLVNDRVMVVDVSVVRPCAYLAPTGSDGLHRVLVFHDPRANVQEVDVLFDNEISREPREVVPVAN